MLIDMHSHILPGADHGSDSLDCSLKQVAKARDVGIEAILCTPHYYQHRDSVKDFLSRREHCLRKLTGALAAQDGAPRLFRGAEVTLEVDLVNDPELPRLCIENTNYLLLEMPVMSKWTEWVYNAVYEIGVRHKVQPIIAHIDRYEEKQVAKLLEMGVLAQVNAASLCSIMTRRRVLKYIRAGQAKFLGSDVHDADAPQYDFYRKALGIIGAEDCGVLMNNAARVLGLSADKEEKRGDGLILF